MLLLQDYCYGYKLLRGYKIARLVTQCCLGGCGGEWTGGVRASVREHSTLVHMQTQLSVRKHSSYGSEMPLLAPIVIMSVHLRVLTKLVTEHRLVNFWQKLIHNKIFSVIFRKDFKKLHKSVIFWNFNWHYSLLCLY